MALHAVASTIAAKSAGESPASTPAGHDGDAAEQNYVAERALLESSRFVPLVALPESVSVGARVRGWQPRADAAWEIADIWIEPERP